MIIKFLEFEFIKHARINKSKDIFDFRIFCGTDVESVIVSRTLSLILQTEFIFYELCPLDTWKEFNIRCLQFYNQKIRFVQLFLINFGGNSNLKVFLERNIPLFLKIFLLDLRTKIHPQNILAKQILIFDPRLHSNFISQKMNQEKKKRLTSLIKKLKIIQSNTKSLSDIISRSNKDDYRGLWFQILSVTGQYLSNAITYKINFIEMNYLNNRLKNINKKNVNKTKSISNVLENLDCFSLEFSKELTLNLLRHWNLVDSAINTPKFAVLFCLWKRTGIKFIAKFFLRMGMTMKDALTPWILIEFKKRNIFLNNIEKKYVKITYLTLKMDSFVKKYYSFVSNQKCEIFEISASDFYYVLESLSDFRIFRSDQKGKIKGFWRSYRALIQLDIVKMGIKISQKIQKFASKIGRLIILKKVYIIEKNSCYSYLKNIQNLNITYEMIKKLSFYLITTFSSPSFKKKKAFIVFVPSLKKTFIGGYLYKKKNSREFFKFKSLILSMGAYFEDDFFFSLELEKHEELNFLKKIKK